MNLEATSTLARCTNSGEELTMRTGLESPDLVRPDVPTMNRYPLLMRRVCLIFDDMRRRKRIPSSSVGPAEAKEDEERVTEEIESLCMKCGEQVRFSLLDAFAIAHSFQ